VQTLRTAISIRRMVLSSDAQVLTRQGCLLVTHAAPRVACRPLLYFLYPSYWVPTVTAPAAALKHVLDEDSKGPEVGVSKLLMILAHSGCLSVPPQGGHEHDWVPDSVC
jgi:hypothetical protein